MDKLFGSVTYGYWNLADKTLQFVCVEHCMERMTFTIFDRNIVKLLCQRHSVTVHQPKEREVNNPENFELSKVSLKLSARHLKSLKTIHQ